MEDPNHSSSMKRTNDDYPHGNMDCEKCSFERENMPLGDRMKTYEKKSELIIEKDKPWMMRLDGRSFSKFTSSLQQPYDLRFIVAMILTAQDLIQEFHATTAYIQSDEISLTFFPEPMKDSDEYPVLPFKGKVQKLVSVSAGYASARFNHHLIALATDEAYYSEFFVGHEVDDLPVHALGKIKSSHAHFDSRCFQLPNDTEVFNNILWRKKDAYKNVVSKVAQYHFGPKACHKKNTQEKLEMIKKNHPEYFEKLHPYISCGVFVKKELYDTIGGDGKECKRSRFKIVSADRLASQQMGLWCRFLRAKIHDIVHPALYSAEDEKDEKTQNTTTNPEFKTYKVDYVDFEYEVKNLDVIKGRSEDHVLCSILKDTREFLKQYPIKDHCKKGIWSDEATNDPRHKYFLMFTNLGYVEFLTEEQSKEMDFVSEIEHEYRLIADRILSISLQVYRKIMLAKVGKRQRIQISEVNSKKK